MRKFFLTLALLSSGASALAQSVPVCNPRTFGAKGDGVTLDTTAVTQAIAACVQQGGGTVYFGPGHYVIGTVQLYSHIHLYLDGGAALVGSHDVKDYLPSKPFGFGREYGVNITGEGEVLGMILAKDANDVSIDGLGEIDGAGDTFMGPHTSLGGGDYIPQYVRNPDAFMAAMRSDEYGPLEFTHRPGTMLVFFHCSNVQIHGITLRQAPNWTLELQDVEGASLSDFAILNDQKVPNNDGIDCMMCRHVEISNFNIITGDDGFAIVGSENIHVSNGSIASRSAAIRLESTKLSTFTGLSMDTNRGIAIFANTYANQENRNTEDVSFSDMVIRTRFVAGNWWGKAEPIHIAIQPCPAKVTCGSRVMNVSFNNISAVAENGALLWGGAGSPITGVELNNVHLHIIAPKPELAASLGGNLDLRWTAPTPRYGITKSDIPALYAKQVAGLRLRDVTVDWADGMPEYFSDGIRVEDFKDLSIEGFAGRQAQSASGAALFLQDGSGVSITNSRAMPGTATFLQLEKVDGRRVFVNYDLSAAAKVLVPATKRFDTQVGVPRTTKGAAGVGGRR
jgi:hypothetical protein